jgi:hypothetical protein
MNDRLKQLSDAAKIRGRMNRKPCERCARIRAAAAALALRVRNTIKGSR